MRDASMNFPLRKRDFYQLVEQYEPLEFEVLEDASWRAFKRPIHYALYNRYRFFLVFQYITEHFLSLSGKALLDLGPYPGTFLRLLRRIWPSEELQLYGAGLKASSPFVSQMEKECSATIFEVNLDPLNPDLAKRNFPASIPLDDNTVDYIFAGEIIEHLTNPSSMLQESFRLLKSGGSMIITTSNVTRIGNVFKLLVGGSSYDRLSPIGSQDPSDEWRRHFHEYEMRELADLVTAHGFRVVHRTHFVGRNTEMVVKSWKHRAIDLAKVPFYLVPHLKDALFIVADKP